MASTVPDIDFYAGGTSQKCEPCNTIDKDVTAELYCDECKEYLCMGCIVFHSTSKILKSHTPQPLTRPSKQCEPCNEITKSNEASHYCRECEEYLCQQCTFNHKRSKATKTHEPVPKKSNETTSRPLSVSEHAHPMTRTPIVDEKHPPKKPQTLDDRITLIPPVAIEIEALQQYSLKIREDTSGKRLVPDSSDENDSLEFFDAVEESDVDSNVAEKSNPNEGESVEWTEISAQQTGHRSPRHIASLTGNDNSEMQMSLQEIQAYEWLGIDPPSNPNQCHVDGQGQLQVHVDDHSTGSDQDTTGERKSTLLTLDIPGKPSAREISSDSITIAWDSPSHFGDQDLYRLEYKEADSGTPWQLVNEDIHIPRVKVPNLKYDTNYVFRTKSICNGVESSYGPTSDNIVTITSPAKRVLPFATKESTGQETPQKYAIPVTELQETIDISARTRKVELQTEWSNCLQSEVYEKTIMLVGETGTGKTTLVDGIANYSLGVRWDDPFRYTILNLPGDEKCLFANQAVSQTDWITCYIINPEPGSRHHYKLNVIDTPGFGDTRGLQRDDELVEQIRQLFSSKPPKGVVCIDVVCFVVKAPDVRLTYTQKYIFQAIMSVFGKDIEDNICYLTTFADGSTPPVLAALEASDLPKGPYFAFNNSSLFANNVVESQFSYMFWNVGIKSFQDFFDGLESFETKSLTLTNDVLQERYMLRLALCNIRPLIDVGLFKVNQLNQEITILEKHETMLSDNKNFKYETTETHQFKKDLARGLHVTNCTKCHFTCHENCKIADDDKKRGCIAIDGITGNCKFCPDKCSWTDHRNTPYIFEYREVKVTKTYAEMQQKYQMATDTLPQMNEIIEKIREEIDDVTQEIDDLMDMIRICNESLAVIALRPNPLSITAHIDNMIRAEEIEKKDGYQERIEQFQEYKKRAKVGADVARFHEELKGVYNEMRKPGNGDMMLMRIGKKINEFRKHALKFKP